MLAPQSHAIQTIGPFDTDVQVAAPAVLGVEASSSVSRLTGGRIPRGAGVGEGDAADAPERAPDPPA